MKKYFSSKSPRGVAMYLLVVTRLTVLSCMPIASAMSRRISGRNDLHAVAEKARPAGCTISVATLRIVVARWCSDLTSQFAACSRSVRYSRSVLFARRPADLRVIAVVDQHARQGLGVELDDPAASGLGPHQDVGHDRLRQRRVEGEAGPRIERFDLGDHLGQILGIDTADPHQRGDVARGQQRQIVEQALHRRVEPVAVAQLQRQAFGRSRAKTPGGSNSCSRASTRSTRAGAQPSRSAAPSSAAAQIAGLVELVEQVKRR